MELMKIDKLNTLFMCQFCKNTFRDPVILPCFEIVCRCDLNKMRVDDSTINCPFCDQNHTEPKNGFQSDKRIKELINLEVNKLDFGKTFNNGKRLLKDFEERINEFEVLTTKPNEYINEYFADIRKKSDLKRSQLQLMINQHFDEINSEINKCEQDCKQGLKNYDEIKSEIGLSRKYLNQWSRDYDSMRLNEEKRDEIISKSFQAKTELEAKLKCLKNDILQNLSYKFQIDDNKLKDKTIFGLIVKSFKFTFDNFCSFKENSQAVIESDKFSINGYKWNIELKHKLGGFMGCYLYCDSKNSERAVLNIDHEFKLINLAAPELSHSIELSNKFNLNENEEYVFGYGDSRFKLFQDIMEEGFYDIENDSVTIEAFIKIKSVIREEDDSH